MPFDLTQLRGFGGFQPQRPKLPNSGGLSSLLKPAPPATIAAPAASQSAAPGFKSTYSGSPTGPWMQTLNPSSASSMYAPHQAPPTAQAPSLFGLDQNQQPGGFQNRQGPRGPRFMMM